MSGNIENVQKIWRILTEDNYKILVDIELGQSEEEQAIFDSINSAGVRLFKDKKNGNGRRKGIKVLADCITTREILECENWTEVEIRNRTNRIINDTEKLWNIHWNDDGSYKPEINQLGYEEGCCWSLNNQNDQFSSKNLSHAEFEGFVINGTWTDMYKKVIEIIASNDNCSDTLLGLRHSVL